MQRIDAAPPPEEGIYLLELLQVLAKRKQFIIRATAGTALLAALISLTLPNVYTATARILPPQKDVGGGLASLLGSAGALAGMAGLGGMGGSSDLYVGILKSRSVEDAVIQRLNLATVYKTKKPEDTRKALEGKVQLQIGVKDGIITISADDKEPQRAAQLANTLIEELGRTSVRLNLSKASTERIFLEKRLDIVKNDLYKAEEELKSFAQTNKTIHIDSQAKASIEGVARLKAELASKEVQIAALRSYQTDENQEVKSLQSAITRLHQEIGVYSGSSGSGEGIPSVGSVPSLGLRYARLLRELKIQEAILEQLTKQYEVAKLSEAKDSSAFQILDTAVIPTKKAKPKRSLIVILATVTAAFISIFTAFTSEFLERMTEEDRERVADIRKNLSIRSLTAFRN